MKHLTYRILSGILVLYFTLFMYRTDTGDLWITSSGSDIRYVPILFLILVLGLIDLLRFLGNTSWKKKNTTTEMTLDAQEARNIHPCELCKEPITEQDKEFCSFRCKFSSLRWKLLLGGIVLLIIGFDYLELQAIAMSIIILGMIGIELTREEREFPNISITNFFGDGVPGFITSKRNPWTKAYNIPKMTVPGLDEQINICCYQTARLEEKYCKCGQGIDPKITTILKE